MNAILFAALAIAQPGVGKHDEQNPLFKRLLDSGLELAPKKMVKFPAPTMPDGLTEKQQTAIIKDLIAKDYDYDEFIRDSVVAPQLLKIRDIEGADPNAPARGIDVWFVVHGNFNLLNDDKFLDKLLSAGKGSGNGKSVQLTGADLKKRNIEIKVGDEKRESYGTVEFDFLEKVRLRATGHAMWSRNPESVVATGEIDPRFLNDKEYSNEWRSIDKLGGMPLGNANPWSGAAVYVKVTKLQAPEGAMFIEQHVVFVEPKGWFDGANLLRSKLPIAMQQSVRTMRQEFRPKPNK